MVENKKISTVAIIKNTFPKMYKAAPMLFIATILVGIFHGMSFGVVTSSTQLLFDEVNKGVIGESTLSRVIIFIVILGGSIILSQVLNGIHNFMFNVYGEKVVGKFTSEINSKCAKIEPVLFEDTKTLDEINKAKNGMNGVFILFVVSTTVLGFYLPYFIYMAIYLFSLDKVLSLAIIVIFIPSALSQYIRIKVFKDLEEGIAPLRREVDYYEETICSREYFKETRMLGAYGYLSKIYKRTLKALGSDIWKAEKKSGLLELLMDVLTLLGYVTVLLMLVNSLMKGRISIGAFSAVFASIALMIDLMDEVIRRHIGSLARQASTIENYFNFFNLKEREGEDKELSLENGIRLKSVSFKYPSVEENSVKNINLHIREKETIAVVGENGSGKSTLVRLITGIYLPTEGEVTYGETSTRDVSLNSIFKNTSAVFQKFQKYKLSLKDNIAISSVDNIDEKLLKEALIKGDLDEKSNIFSEGFDTILSKEFDGVDLSGGEWQRVAIARGFYRNHEFLVLDEPTAAIDPIEESKLYNKFKSLSEGKTSIIVTHRLGSAKIADRILVMDNGEIVEKGSHEELIALGGKYKEMYDSQAKWYV